MKNLNRVFSMLVLSMLVLSMLAVSAHASIIPVLGSDVAYAVLSATGVKNTNASTVNGGNVGSYPSSGSDTGTGIFGADHISYTGGGPLPATALNQSDLANAISVLDGLPATALSPPSVNFTAGNATFLPGVYSVGAIFTLTGNLILDAGGASNADFIFQVGSALIANVGSNVTLMNAGTNDAVYWVEGSSATLNGSNFVGNVLAHTSITMGSAVTINCGRALANTGTVTMIGDTINTGCSGTAYIDTTTGKVVTTQPPPGGGDTIPPPGPPPTGQFNVPEPSTLMMLATGLLGWGGFVRRKIVR